MECAAEQSTGRQPGHRSEVMDDSGHQASSMSPADTCKQGDASPSGGSWTQERIRLLQQNSGACVIQLTIGYSPLAPMHVQT